MLAICIVFLIRCEVKLCPECGFAYKFVNEKTRIMKPNVVVSTHPWWAHAISPKGFRCRSTVIHSNSGIGEQANKGAPSMLGKDGSTLSKLGNGMGMFSMLDGGRGVFSILSNGRAMSSMLNSGRGDSTSLSIPTNSSCNKFASWDTVGDKGPGWFCPVDGKMEYEMDWMDVWEVGWMNG